MIAIRTFLLGILLSSLIPAQAYFQYRLDLLEPNTHTLVIELAVSANEQGYTDFQLATWRPGRYILQDYAASLSHFEATRPNGSPLQWHKVSPSSWRVYAQGGKITLRYRYYAANQDAGSSYYGDGQLYFNPVNCFLYVQDQINEPVQLTLPKLSKEWKLATALRPKKGGKALLADSWHEFADSPTVLSPQMKQLSFQTAGTTFHLHFQGDYQGDAETDAAALEMVEKICKEQAAIFESFPFETYHFIYRLVPFEMRHAVEHSRSASFALPARVTGSADKIISGIGGITSHEFWHVWNVKRIRPAALWPYDYRAPQYSSLHWFTEGVTDYYTHLTLARAEVQRKEYLYRQLGRTIQSLENNYAATVVSPSQSSADSWLATSPYRHPFHGISYYTLGSRLGFLIDLRLRQQTAGAKGLDEVFRYLYETYYLKGEGVPENGIQTALTKLSGNDWTDWFNRYVHSTEPIPYDRLLEPMGLRLEVAAKRDNGYKRLGILNLDARPNGLLVRRIHPAGDAYRDGLGQNDLIVGLEGKPIDLSRLNDAVNALEKGESLTLTVARGGQQTQDITIACQEAYQSKSYEIIENEDASSAQKALREGWLSSKQDK